MVSIVSIWLLTIVVAYGCTVVMMFLFQRSFMYYPSALGLPPAAFGLADMDAISLTTEDGLTLTSWYKPAQPGYHTILYSHGNGGHIGLRAPLARTLLDAGYGLLLLEYRGYGDNPGRPTEAGLYADARAGLAYLESAGVPIQQVVFYGESLGTGVAVQMASEYQGAGIILESPFTSTVDVAAGAFWWLPVRWVMRDRYDSARKIATIASPLLIYHGDADMVVPLALGQDLFAAATAPKQMEIIADARHDNVFAHGGREVVLRFLRQLAAPQTGS